MAANGGRVFRWVLATVLLTIVSIGPVAADTVLRRGNGAEPGTLDPLKFETVPEDRILSDLYKGLTAPGPGGTIRPGAAMWKQALDVEVTLENQEFKTYIDTMKQRKTTQAYRAAFISFYDDPLPLSETLRGGAVYNYTGYRSDAYDRLFTEASGARTIEDRYRLFAEAETVQLADVPVAPIYFYAAEHLIKPYVQGWQPSPRDSFRSQDLTILPH